MIDERGAPQPLDAMSDFLKRAFAGGQPVKRAPRHPGVERLLARDKVALFLGHGIDPHRSSLHFAA